MCLSYLLTRQVYPILQNDMVWTVFFGQGEKSQLFFMSLIMRKPVFGVCDQDRLNPVCAVTETRPRLEISDEETRGIILSRQRITKALIRLQMCRVICAFVVPIWHKQVFS